MFKHSTNRPWAKHLGMLCIASVVLPVAAQQSTPNSANSADPLSPAASVPAVTYQSPFAGYRPMVDQKIGNWRDANDNVNRIGGWRTYLKEAQEPDAPMQKQTPQPVGRAAPQMPSDQQQQQQQQQQHQHGHSGHTAK